MHRFIRAAALAAAGVLGAVSLAFAAEQNPETQLLTALDELDHGHLNEAWTALDELVKRQPNFRLARLFHNELAAARSGSAVKDVYAANDPELQGLAEEARLRLAQWRERIPDNTAPDVFLQLAKVHRHAVVVDLPRARLYLLEIADGGAIRVVKNFYAASGKGGWGKRKGGDNRTPLGIYHVTGFIPDAKLPELYGAGAFPVSYPNVWDQRLGYTGSGIWLHGVPRATYARVPRSSEGCVTLANSDLMELKSFLALGETPVVFTDTLAWRPQGSSGDLREEFAGQVEQWRHRWSALDTEGYLGFYADDFETDGMNKKAFAEYKRRVNKHKKRVEVRLENVDLFRYPGNEGLMLAHFIQHYSSDNFRLRSEKDQFWRREPDGRWRIVKESSR
jgi:murein L,D-transpeptidase YafK